MKYQINPIHLIELLKEPTDILQFKELYFKFKLQFNREHFLIVCDLLQNYNDRIEKINIFADICNNWICFEEKKVSELVLILKTAAKLKINHHIIKRIYDEIKYSYKVFNPQNIVDITWASAVLNINDPEILKYLIESIKTNYKLFNGINISTIIWSCAVLNIDNSDLILYIINSIKSNYQLFNAQCISNIIWACAVLNIQDYSLLHELVSIITCNYHLFNYQGITQIKQAFLFYDIKDPEIDKLFNSCKTDTPTISKFQQSIGEICEYLGYAISYEVELFNGLYSGDIIIEYKDRLLILECDGPFHYLLDGTYNGSTKLRNKLYDKYGINYLSISYFEFKSTHKYLIADFIKNEIEKHYDRLFNVEPCKTSKKRSRSSSSDRDVKRPSSDRDVKRPRNQY